MKFLCPSCKAKYQIGDDKVAGRSVRMKCRKCGYVIQVSSVPGQGDALAGSDPPPPIEALSDVSAAAALDVPVAPPSALGTPRPAPAAKSAPASSATPAGSRVAPKSAAAAASAPATSSSPTTAQRPEGPKAPLAGARATAPQKPAFAPSAPKAPLAPAPKPPSAKSAPQKPTATPGSATPEARRTLQGGVGTPLPAVAPTPAAKPATRAASPFPEVEEEERTRIAEVGALAGAFSLAVGGIGDPASHDSLSMPADEWFVGINGVPVGPIRLSELRSKAASGSVNRESLVWRDGFEDWRPLGTFPELSAIVDESLSTARASLTPFTPSVATVLSPLPGTVSAVPAASSPEVEAYAGSGNGVTGAAVVTDELEAAAGVPKRGGTSPAAWIAVGIALMFGLTIGFVLFNKGSKTVEVVKYVDRVVPGAPSGVVAAPEPSAFVNEGSNTPVDHPVKRGPAPVKSGISSPVAEQDKGISGLKSLQNPGSAGPGRGPDVSGPSGTVSGAGQLDGAQIQSTVSRYTGSVKRACWQPALDTRDKDAPTTARVNVAITVLPSGSVSNAVVNGGDPKGYRGLSQCISSRVRGWQFPPSGDTTTVNVPFVFAAQ
jgi:predicted Zn finger-like uncharacterized protein